MHDYSPERGRNYYRLKQTDLDGTSSHSKTVAVNITTAVKLRLYPNPASGLVRIDAGDDTIQSVEVLNIHGARVLQASSTGQIDLGGLTPGVYVVRASDANGPVAWENVVKQ